MFLTGYALGVLSSCFLVFMSALFFRLLNKTPDQSIIPSRIFNAVSKKGKKAPLVQDDDKAYRKEVERGLQNG